MRKGHNKTVYLPDCGGTWWEDAQRVAAVRGETVSAVIKKTLRKYVNDNQPLLIAVERAKRVVDKENVNR